MSDYNATTRPSMENEDDAIVEAVIHRHIDALNRQDAAGLAADFLESGTLIDAFPPFLWEGAGATDAWLRDLDATIRPHGLDKVENGISGWQRFFVAGDHAYAVAHGVSRISGPTFQVEARGTWSFILRRVNGAWKIANWTWGGPPAEPVAD